MRSFDREIRLLDLLPGTGQQTIRCTTRVVCLDEHPDFETVSYVWGDRVGEEVIDVSGNLIVVTKNLHAGLLRLRHPTDRRTLWIDQICINQWDLEEKSAQVALMRDIYKQCTRCVTWMGELTRHGVEIPVHDAEAVFEFLIQAAGAMVVPVLSLPILFEPTEQGLAVRKAFEQFSMYGNPWWSRIWTVQEAIIPPSGVLVWGPLSISRETVLTAARNLRELNSWLSLPDGYASCRHTYTELLRRLLYPVHGFNHSKHDNAMNLLMRWRHREFTDPRDKVYVLLGMITPGAIPSARYCDYTIAVPQLFAQVTKDLIEHEDSLRPLLGACEMPHSTPGVPSWAIDFACCNRIGKRQLKWWGHSHRYKVFSACRSNALVLFRATGRDVLGLRGAYVDEVKDTIELLRVDAHDSVQLCDLRGPLRASSKLLEQHRKYAQRSEFYKDGFTWISAFCRTLVGDLIMDEIPVSRIASCGRSPLEAQFRALFDVLEIHLDENLDLNFVPFSPTGSPFTPTIGYTPRSYSYSPSSPLPRSPVFPSTSPLAPSTEVNGRSNAGHVATADDSELLVASLPILKRSNSNASLATFTSLESQQSYTSEVPASYRKFGKLTTRSIETDATRDDILPDTGVTTSSTKDSEYAEGHMEDKHHMRGGRSDAAGGLGLKDIHAVSKGLRASREWPSPQIGTELFSDLYESLVGMMENQTFFITKTGYIGIGPPQTRPGDQVWILNGGNVPFIMRRFGEAKDGCPQLMLVGDAYVHAVMDGEVMGDLDVQTVHIH